MSASRAAGASGGPAPLVPPSVYQAPAWAAGATGRGVTVAVVDSGWHRERNDARVLPGIAIEVDGDGTVRETEDDRDRTGHGTGVAHHLLAVAPGCHVLPVRVFGESIETSPRVLVAGIDAAMRLGAGVVNLSLGTDSEDALRPLYAACIRARQAGAILVAAGGNIGETAYPAVFDPVIGVSAGEFASPFDFRYHANAALEVEALAMRVPVVTLNGRRRGAAGTSVAAGGVSGIVARLLEMHPGASVDDIRALLARFAAR